MLNKEQFTEKMNALANQIMGSVIQYINEEDYEFEPGEFEALVTASLCVVVLQTTGKMLPKELQLTKEHKNLLKSFYKMLNEMYDTSKKIDTMIQ